MEPYYNRLFDNSKFAGLESPAPMNNITPKASNGAFNWLDSKMSDLKIGKKSLNAMALEKQVSRNTTVFQFPDTKPQIPTQTVKGAFNQSSEGKVGNQPITNEPTYAVVRKAPKKPETQQKTVQPWPIQHHPQCNTQRPQSMTQQPQIMTQSYPGPNILQPQEVSKAF